MDVQPITAALARVESGEPGADEALWQLVYRDLKQIANLRLARLPPGQTLQATALVHEAWVRLSREQQSGWQGRSHFFAAAARSMRNILVDQARSKQRLRRNAGRKAEPLGDDVAAVEALPAVDMLALDEALDALASEYERPARVVMLRYFAGLELADIAELLQVTTRTVDRDFLFARTWLRGHMGAD